jgi:hypothetical protein
VSRAVSTQPHRRNGAGVPVEDQRPSGWLIAVRTEFRISILQGQRMEYAAMIGEYENQVMVAGLHRIAQRLQLARDSRELCRLLAGAVAEELALPDVVVYLRSGSRRQYAQVGAAGDKARADGGVLVPLIVTTAEGIVGSAARSAQTIRVDSTLHDARYIVDDQSRLAELSVPICYQGEALGVLDAEHAEAGFFQPRHELGFQLASELAAPRLAELMSREGQRREFSAPPRSGNAESASTPPCGNLAQALDPVEFGAAVERALLRISAPQELLKSALLDCALLCQAQAANPVLQIRQLLADAIDSLIADARTATLGRSLKLAYFEAPDSRALLASRLHIGESTLRRRLKLARDTLVATLWAAELAARGMASAGRANERRVSGR